MLGARGGGAEALGHGAAAVDLPVDRRDATTADYARVAAAAFGGGEPPIVVAHSMAGLVAPLLAGLIPVRGVIYLAALLRRPGRSLADDRADGLNADISPPAFGRELQRDEAGLTWWPSAEAVARHLFQDASDADAAWAFARLRHQKGYWSDRARRRGLAGGAEGLDRLRRGPRHHAGLVAAHGARLARRRSGRLSRRPFAPHYPPARTGRIAGQAGGNRLRRLKTG